MLKLILGFILPFVGTTLGSFLVFFLNKKLNQKINSLLLGFASGVMVAASIWSLILPAINTSPFSKTLSWLPVSIGIVVGFLFLFLMDKTIPSTTKSNSISKQNKMLILAVSLHNIPEGMAVGIALAGAFFGNTSLSMTGALALSIGIAVQNFPEGSIVSLPLSASGISKTKSFFLGTLSGAIEPIFSILTFFIAGLISNLLPYILSFSAGTMLYVVVNEILPESSTESEKNISTFGFFIGFLIMMILDIMLG